MQRSDSIANLAKALAAAMPKVGAIVKDKKADISAKSKDGKDIRYNYNYADLASVIEAYTDALSSQGLAILQPVGGPRDGHLVLTTMLVHESGEWISEEYPVPMYQRAQDQGSAITYARRYTVNALLGLASEDDDGKAASDDKAPRGTTRKPAPAPAKPPSPAPAADVPAREPLSQEQRRLMLDAARALGLVVGTDYARFLEFCQGVLGRPIDKSAGIAAMEFDLVMNAISEKAEQMLEEQKNESIREAFGPGAEG